ncbi:MAG: hypothetical protein JJU10_07675 [Idiomarina sp.]|nr:hypothetical protein [Idiomarina sp.]
MRHRNSLFILLLIALISTNQFGNDYLTLKHAYNIQQESFGTVFILLSRLFYSLGLDYWFLHIFYCVILSFSVSRLSENLISPILVFIILGSILNEQTRYFSAALLALYLLVRYSAWLTLLTFVIHPAGSLMISAVGILYSVIHKMSLIWKVLLIFACFMMSPVVKIAILWIGGQLGYQYEGTVHSEVISNFGLVFILYCAFAVLVGFQFINRSGLPYANRNQSILLAVAGLAAFSSEFAIISGRYLITLTILLSCMLVFPKLGSFFKESLRIKKWHAASLCAFMPIVSVWAFRMIL